jgi:hypothetical protein
MRMRLAVQWGNRAKRRRCGGVIRPDHYLGALLLKISMAFAALKPSLAHQ